MKKIMIIVLFFLVTLHLAACTNSPNKTENFENQMQDDNAVKEDITITLWTYPVGNWGNATNVSDMIFQFNKSYPNIHVSVTYLDYDTGDDRVNEAIENGQSPDLILEGPERLIANWGNRGLLVDLSDLWSTDTANQIYDSIRSACRHNNGEYYEFPICMTAHCMAINYDMFEAAGALSYIDMENRTWTTENFIQAVNALTAYGQKNVGMVYCGNQGGDQGTRALITNLYGGTFTNMDHTKYTFNSKENIQALQLLYDLDGIQYNPSIVGSDEIAMFCTGELAMAFCWNVSQELAQTINYPDRDFDIVPMAFPTNSGNPELQGGIWGFGIFNNGDEEKIQAAKTFIDFMTTDDAQYSKTVLTSSYWPVRDMDNIYANDEIMTEYGIFMQYMGDYYQVAPGWTTVRTEWWKMLQKIGSGTDVTNAVEEFSDAANDAINSN